MKPTNPYGRVTPNQVQPSHPQKNQQSRLVTPKPRRSVDVSNFRQVQKNVTTPQSHQSIKIPEPMLTYKSNVSSVVQNLNPTPTRYGADRRARTQKVQQVIAKYKEQPSKPAQQVYDPDIDLIEQNVYQNLNEKINANSPNSQVKIQPLKKQRYSLNSNSQQKNIRQSSSQLKATNETPQKNANIGANISTANKQSRVKTPARTIQPFVNKQQSRQNSTKIQIKSKTNLQLKSQQKSSNNSPNKQTPKKTPNKVLIFILNNIYRRKLAQNFNQIIHRSMKIKQKKGKYSKIFVHKLFFVQSHINLEICRFAFYKFIKQTSPNKKNSTNNQHPNSPNKNNKSIHKQNPADKLQHLHANSRKYVPLLLVRIFKNKMLHNLAKIKDYNNSYHERTENQKKLIPVLSSLFKKKVGLYFHKLTNCLHDAQNNKLCHITNACSILKQYKIKMYLKFFRKLVIFNNEKKKIQSLNSQDSKKQKAPSLNNNQLNKGLRTHQRTKSQTTLPQVQALKGEKQNEILIRNLEQKSRQLTHKLKQIKQQAKRAQMKLKQNTQILKKANGQLVELNYSKQKMQAQLKQKAQEINFNQQDYISGSQISLDSRFSILYDIYIKLQKSSLDQISISDLYALYPMIEQQITKDQQVMEWVTLGHNLWLKNQINKYQGLSEVERRAARLAFEEQSQIIQLIKGYIKQRYTWEWVKTALCNVNT